MVFEKRPGCGNYLKDNISDSVTQMNSPDFLLLSGKNINENQTVRKSIMKNPN